MAHDPGVPAASLSLALTSCLPPLALFIPASGTLADRFGSQAIFCGAIGVFLTGSIVCAQAASLLMLVAARFVQGMCGAMMVPVGRLVLLCSVGRKDMVQALSWLVLPALIGPILGPPLGGLIATWLDWRWVFYLSLPIGIAGILGARMLIPDIRGAGPQRFDTGGFVLSGIALGCLLFGFELASHRGTWWIATRLVAVGLLAGIAGLRHARRPADPILDPRLLWACR